MQSFFPIKVRWLVSLLSILFLPPDLPAAEPASNTPSPALQPFAHSLDLFPIMPWDPLHDWKPPFRNPKHGLESIAECSFTLAGFVKPEDLPLCEKLGSRPQKGLELGLFI